MRGSCLCSTILARLIGSWDRESVVTGVDSIGDNSSNGSSYHTGVTSVIGARCDCFSLCCRNGCSENSSWDILCNGR